jgi:hypothetical protein
MSAERRRLVYDINLLRPACVLLQVPFGGEVAAAKMFPSECWLTEPTPDMKCYLMTEEQLKQLVEYHGGIYTARNG